MPEYRLKQDGIHELENLLFEVSKWKSTNLLKGKEVIFKAEIKESDKSPEMIVYHGTMPMTGGQLQNSNNRVECNLELISSDEAKIERKLLLYEYRDGHEWGKHWDLLRWNVSKFFLSIQTVFVIGAFKGLFDLEIDPKLEVFLDIGIIGIALINIFLCVIWWLRNKEIHAWHRNSITRQRMIELDPRLRQTIMYYSTIIRRLKWWCHLTGELECWGPPLAFTILWSIIICLSNWQIGLVFFLILLAVVFVLFFHKYRNINKKKNDCNVEN